MQSPGGSAPATPSTQSPRTTPATRAPVSMPLKVLYSISSRTSGSLETERDVGLSRNARAVTPTAWET